MSTDGAGPARRLRVALLSPCYWPEVRRGGERFVHDLGVGLVGRGLRPRLITSHRGRPSRSVEDGLPVVRVPRLPDGRLERRRFEHHLTHVPFSYAALSAGDDEIAQAIYPTDALAAARWTRRTGRPSILSYLGIPDRVGLVDRRRRVEITRSAIAGCTVTTALSRTAAEAFHHWLGVEARVLYPGVDLSAFAPAAERDEAPTIFCGADAGEPRKQVGLLIEAFAQVRRERPEARLALSRPRDPRVAERLGRDVPGVTWVDVDDRAALARAYARAWVSALPSFGEAFGLVLVEAMACGTPVVGTGVGAIPEVIDRPEVGRLFARGDAEGLACGLLEAFELAEDPGTAAACRARAEDFSLDAFVDAHLQLYADLLR